MAKPDWGKAPEDATHYGPEGGFFSPAWYTKNKGGGWLCKLVGEEADDWYVVTFTPELIARPQAEKEVKTCPT